MDNYLHQADAQMYTLIQTKMAGSLEHLDAILAADGVDGAFTGPGDFVASMGHLGAPGHLEVREAIDDAVQRIVASDKAVGIPSADQAQAKHYLSLGAMFIVMGTDVTLLARSAEQLAKAFKGDDTANPQPAASVY